MVPLRFFEGHRGEAVEYPKNTGRLLPAQALVVIPGEFKVPVDLGGVLFPTQWDAPHASTEKIPPLNPLVSPGYNIGLPGATG